MKQIDDEVALDLVDYWIANPGKERTIPNNLENKVTLNAVHILQRPYRIKGKMP